jgi:nitrite reductase (NO-forming)
MKKLSYVLALGFIGFAIALNSCSSGTEKKTQKSETVIQQDAEEAEAVVTSNNEMASQMARGEQIYKEKCIACHQANGQGLANVFPTLLASDFLINQKALAVSQVLNGSEKVAADKSIKYPAPMPPQVDTHEDAVAVINYVLNNFGNDAGYVSMDDVKDIVIEPR